MPRSAGGRTAPAEGVDRPDAEDVRLIQGDALEVLATFDSATVDAVISDPPHGVGAGPWDVLPSIDLVRALFRVLRPGGKLVFIGDDRTWHRLVVVIEDAGFTIEGHCIWLFATGRPRTATQPRPAFAPVIVARTTGAPLLTNIDEARVPWRDDQDRRQSVRANTLHGAGRRVLAEDLDRGKIYRPHEAGRWATSVWPRTTWLAASNTSSMCPRFGIRSLIPVPSRSS